MVGPPSPCGLTGISVGAKPRYFGLSSYSILSLLFSMVVAVATNAQAKLSRTKMAGALNVRLRAGIRFVTEIVRAGIL